VQKLAGKTALVTGGASGIGLGMARAFIAAGLRVAIADINDNALEVAEAALPGLGKAVKLDVTRATEWEYAVEAVEAVLGPVDTRRSRHWLTRCRYRSAKNSMPSNR
jgi:NAD(P)-dependent dehydrogenase (short-subunit alcohol dehydrogenase family)